MFWELRGLRVNGKENGNYYVIQGYIGVRLRDNGIKMETTMSYGSDIGVILRENGKENGNYCII